ALENVSHTSYDFVHIRVTTPNGHVRQPRGRKRFAGGFIALPPPCPSRNGAGTPPRRNLPWRGFPYRGRFRHRKEPNELRVSTDAEIAIAFKTIAEQRIGAITVAAGPFFDTRREGGRWRGAGYRVAQATRANVT